MTSRVRRRGTRLSIFHLFSLHFKVGMLFIICCAELSNRAAIKLQFLAVHLHSSSPECACSVIICHRPEHSSTRASVVFTGECPVPVTDQRDMPLTMMMIGGGCDH